MELYQASGSKFSLSDELKGHEKTVTGVDIAPKSGRIVTCSQGAFFEGRIQFVTANHTSIGTQTATLTSGKRPLLAGSLRSSSSGSTALQPLCDGRRLSRSLPLVRAPV